MGTIIINSYEKPKGAWGPRQERFGKHKRTIKCLKENCKWSRTRMSCNLETWCFVNHSKQISARCSLESKQLLNILSDVPKWINRTFAATSTTFTRACGNLCSIPTHVANPLLLSTLGVYYMRSFTSISFGPEFVCLQKQGCQNTPAMKERICPVQKHDSNTSN